MELIGPGATPGDLAANEDERERTADTRLRGLLVLQLAARGYALGTVAQLRSESLAELVVSLRETLDALGVATVREGVREARRRGLII